MAQSGGMPTIEPFRWPLDNPAPTQPNSIQSSQHHPLPATETITFKPAAQPKRKNTSARLNAKGDIQMFTSKSMRNECNSKEVQIIVITHNVRSPTQIPVTLLIQDLTRYRLL
jgi:hypothetical protein